MKNKVLATLLAVCLFVGLAIPAFASATSSQSGDAADVTKVTFAKDSYSIKKDGSEDFKDEVKAFVDDSKLVLDPSLSFELADNNAGVFSITDDVIYAVEKTGSATLVVKNIDEKVVGKVKISATAAAPAVKDATGFKFENKSYDVPVASVAKNNVAAATAAPDFKLKLIPTPTNSAFADSEVATISTAAAAAIEKALESTSGKSVTVTGATKVDGDGNIVITVAGAGLDAALVNDQQAKDKNIAVETTVNGKAVTVKTSVKAVAGKVAIGVSAPSEITIEVGETFKLGDKAKFVASDSNLNNGKSFEEDYINDDASDYDFAIVDGDGVVTGVAVGKNKIITSTSYVGADKDGNPNAKSTDKTATTIVNVVKRGTKAPDAGSVALANSVANTKVGGTFKMVVKNAPADAKITYSSFDEKVAKIAADGTVTAIGAGTTKVVADVNGTKLYCTVTVAAAPATSNPDKPTTVPETVDALLVNLF